MAQPAQITLEDYVARLNAQAFWREFTFARNTFSPVPGQELELADNFVWLGDFAFALQLKQREGATSDSERERGWFKKKVLTNGTRQIRDTLRFLKAHEDIQITNERGHRFDVRGAALTDVTKIIVYFGSRALPEECWQTRHYVSDTAGFIHVVAAHDYLGIVETLRVPKDIRDYFAYRQEVVPQVRGTAIGEADIMGSFITSEALPTPSSHKHLRRFVQDVETFDLSFLIGRLHDHIQKGDRLQNYYQIMLEFARVPRSVWREVRTRFDLCFQAVKKSEFIQPFRFSFPGSSCTFMMAALDPKLPSTGAEGERFRINGLMSLTYGAMYDASMSKSIGILISKDGEFYQIDWCRLDMPAEKDPEIEAWLANCNPFRPAREKIINSFIFQADEA
jgi:hypothetical protein